MALITSVWALDALILLFSGFAALYFYMTRNYNHWKERGVKAWPTTLFFGNTAPLIFARKTPDTFLKELYVDSKNEKAVGFYVFDKPYLMIKDPELIKNIFVKDFANFANKMLGARDDDVMGSMNLFLAKNPPWKHIRQKLTPIFTTGKLKKYLDLMLEIREDFNNYMDSLEIDGKQGKIVEISEIGAALMTDIIGIVAFGLNFHSLTDPNAEFRKQGRAMFKGGYRRYIELMSVFFMPILRSFFNGKFFGEEGTKFLRTSFWQVINQRMDSGAKRNDLIDILIDIKKTQENDDSDNFKLEGDALVAQAAVFFSGGFETSSTTLTFAMFELARNPDIQTKLREELRSAIHENGGKITYEMVLNLPYLNMVVNEALRMYPVLPWLDRVPESDYKIAGTNTVVKKGTPCILPMRAIQMDPDYWKNPEKFDPERFSEENKKNIIPYTYFPFGDGPRNCIGSRLGQIQVKLGLTFFLTKYEFSPCKETHIPVKLDHFNVLTHSVNGMPLLVKKVAA